MAKILFTWELGLGLGHIMSIKPLALKLQNRGHEVHVSLRDITHAERVFGGTGIKYFPAPVKQGEGSGLKKPACSFGHILHNVGLGSESDLVAICKSWCNLYSMLRPDVVVADHAPASLIAARIERITAIAMGTGFSCPDDRSPWPNWRPEVSITTEQLQRDEEHVLQLVNRLLRSSEASPLRSLGELYGPAVEKLLLTYQELDPFSDRTDGEYIGGFPDERSGEPPRWPSGQRRVLAYLKPFEGIASLLGAIREIGLSTIVRGSGLAPRFVRQHECDTISFPDHFIDFPLAFEECEFGIVNATHLTSASLLRAGKPLLMIPPFLEQRLTAQKIVQFGAGICCRPKMPKQAFGNALKALITKPQFRTRAEAFAAKYADFDQLQQLEKAVDKIESCVNR